MQIVAKNPGHFKGGSRTLALVAAISAVSSALIKIKNCIQSTRRSIGDSLAPTTTAHPRQFLRL